MAIHAPIETHLSKPKIGRGFQGLLVLGLALGFMAEGGATPLNLVRMDPDITVQPVYINYDAGTDHFTATVQSPIPVFQYVPGPLDITDGTYLIDVQIDAAGNLQTGGTVTLRGDLAGDANGIVDIFVGNLVEFGYDDSGASVGVGVFEFIVDITSGAYGFSPNKQGGIILSTFALSSNWSFNASFSDTSSTAVSDNFFVPEPSSLTLLGIGSLMAFLRKRPRASTLNEPVSA
jgi:hypothetical protein